jgi:hypothetical protein
MAGEQRKQVHRRKSIRLPEYDYAQPGAYFVTMVTDKRRHLFGRVRGGVMWLSTFEFPGCDCWVV